ncbi:hypothetical protein BLOT_005850 [Blomia tropicalis]|nr:hypothetical protein BLOT_005850 [Blomia tropicalis]
MNCMYSVRDVVQFVISHERNLAYSTIPISQFRNNKKKGSVRNEKNSLQLFLFIYLFTLIISLIACA